jgi:hypothetical protein
MAEVTGLDIMMDIGTVTMAEVIILDITILIITIHITDHAATEVVHQMEPAANLGL